MSPSGRYRGAILFLCTLLICATPRAAGQRVFSIPLSGDRLDVDIAGNVYVLDARSATLTLLDKTGKVLMRAGGPGWGNGEFDRPSGLWARNGIDVFVADYGNHRIQRLDRTISFVSALNTRDNESPEERFGYPTDVSVSSVGDLYLCDSENSRVVKVGIGSQSIAGFGGIGAGQGRLLRPSEVAVGPRDRVYVLDGVRVVTFDAFGNYLSEMGTGILASPRSLSADERSVNVLDGDQLVRFDAEGRPLQAVTLDSIGGPPGPQLTACVVTEDLMYCLTGDSLIVVRGLRLDKEVKSR